AAVAGSALPNELRNKGVHVDDVTVYRTTPPAAEHLAAIQQTFARRTVDVILFTSASTVDHLCDAIADLSLLSGVLVASIGPITSEAARKRGLKIDVEPATATLGALVEALEAHARAKEA